MSKENLTKCFGSNFKGKCDVPSEFENKEQSFKQDSIILVWDNLTEIIICLKKLSVQELMPGGQTTVPKEII